MNSRITDGDFRNFAFQLKRMYKSAGKVSRSFRFGSSVRLRAATLHLQFLCLPF